MHPPLTARPRPPARSQPRSTSCSKFTALPTPSTPRRRRQSQLEPDAGEEGSWGRPSAPRTSGDAAQSESVREQGRDSARGSLGTASSDTHEELVRSPQAGLDEPSTPPAPMLDTPGRPRDARDKPAGALVPFPTEENPFSTGADTAPHQDEPPLEVRVDATGASMDEGDATIDIEALRVLSREELESMLQEADRIIREKEQELSTFTAAGEELLNEFNQLRQRHESLAGRTPARPAGSTPQRSSRNTTLCGTSPSPTVGGGKRRSWRISLGFPPPTATPIDSSTPTHHRRIPSGFGYRQRDPSGEASPTAAFRICAPSTVTPDGSPTSTRRRHISSTAALSPYNASSKAVLSPSSAANELASLNQVNYSLTLQLSDLHTESEMTEREGRKRLRKLERELQAVREDLERAEHRNAVLETEADLLKERENELARSTRAGPTPRRPAVVPIALDTQDSPSFDWRVKPDPFPAADDDVKEHLSPTRNFGPPTPLAKEVVPDGIFSHQSASPPSAGPLAFPTVGDMFLSSSLAAPFQRPVSRSISTSSLAPLPLPMQLDPSLDKQADELIEQLMQKIDELQDANEIIAHEREHMEHRLIQAQEEVDEWKERCEELAEENAIGRLGWDGPKGAIAWHSDEDADADTDAPRAAIRPRARRITRRSRLLTQNSNTPTSLSSDIFSGSTAGGDSPSPSSSPQIELSKRALSSELGEQYEHDSYTRDVDYLSGGSVSSIVVHSPRPKTRRSRVHRSVDDPYGTSSTSPPLTTADDLLAPGSLRWAGHPEAETYDQLEQAADGLMPAWADDDDFSATSSSPVRVERRLGGGAQWEEPDLSKHRAKSGQKGRGKGRGKSRAGLLPSSFDLDDEYGPEVVAVGKSSSAQTKRSLAARRLDREASTRTGLDLVPVQKAAYPDDDYTSDESAISSTYDELDHPLTRTSDYYPLALRSRYHPRMLATMMADSAMRHVVTLITWIQFLVVLGMALGFALWQGPKKTLGLVNGRRRLR